MCDHQLIIITVYPVSVNGGLSTLQITATTAAELTLSRPFSFCYPGRPEHATARLVNHSSCNSRSPPRHLLSCVGSSTQISESSIFQLQIAPNTVAELESSIFQLLITTKIAAELTLSRPFNFCYPGRCVQALLLLGQSCADTDLCATIQTD
ncbi:hypothetical protein J6590_046392 [Homalodisca vitripennis]|nr:hypothetical protein J6590_046392 [Homalodisca vitripennis]